MSKSKGNELLQDLYERLTGHWYNKGKYAGQSFSVSDVKCHIEKILFEYRENGDEKITDDK